MNDSTTPKGGPLENVPVSVMNARLVASREYALDRSYESGSGAKFVSNFWPREEWDKRKNPAVQFARDQKIKKR